MRFIIEDRAYDAGALQDVSLTDILLIKRQTGRSMADIEAAMTTFPVGDAALGELTEEHLVAVSVLIWLARRKAGERDLTIEAAADFPLRRLRIEGDEQPEVGAPVDPSAAAGPAA